MKTRFSTLVLVVAIAFAGCIKNKTFRTYTITRPVYSLKQEIRDNARLGTPREMENTGSFALYNQLMLICERGQGIHVVDYSSPSSPVNRGFIPIPGNTGIAVKNNVLYADCYSYLLLLRIHAPDDIRFEKDLANAFTSRANSTGADQVLHVTWITKDTTVSTDSPYRGGYYEKGDNPASQSIQPNMMTATPYNPGNGSSVGSSMAVFAVVNDFLYTVDQSRLTSFSISDPANPALQNSQIVTGGDVETIFPFSDKLFIGTRTGMYMYSIIDPATPAYLSMYQHVRVCDPVIADDQFAYVTLRSGSGCGGFLNSLDVLNIQDVANPAIVRSYPFSNPHGLSKDGNVLFLCDGSAGLRVLDASDPADIKTVSTIAAGNCLDVVAMGQHAFVMLDNAIKIYTYDQQFNVQLMGTVSK